jgi:phage terminase large subunit-like protein
VVGRQNGKNALLEMRELYGMLALGERFLHTAHQVKTAHKAFRRLLWFFDNPKKFPKLHARTTMVRKANGQECIMLDNGGSFELVARTNLSGLGFSVDVLVMDEAQDLTEEELGALLPTISASPNPQRIYTGTPPNPSQAGAVFTRLRDAALAGGDKRLCWHGWSAGDGAVDLDDPRVWATANPAQGIRLHTDTISDERADMDDEQFMRQRLGMWSVAGVHRIISADTWAACAPAGLLDGDAPAALSIDVMQDRNGASICAASWTVDGFPYVDVVESRRGEPDWGIEKIAAICGRHHVRAVVIDAGSASASLIDPLRQRGITVTTPTVRQVTAATGGFYDAVMDQRVRHLDQPLLNVALSVAGRRNVGDAGWTWSRKDSTSDITPLVTATLALWGLTSSEVAEQPRVRTGHAVFL